MNQKYKSEIKFVIYTFFALSFFLIALASIMYPSLTVEAILAHRVYSRLGAPLGCIVHVIGNLIFASIALLFAFRNLSK